ncbi:MAG: ATP-binding protein [Candidatus Scatovivens sp.]
MSKKFKSLKTRLFFTLCIVVCVIIAFFIIVNNILLSSYFYHIKVNDFKDTYYKIDNLNFEELNNEVLEKICLENNFNIIIKDKEKVIFSDTNDFMENFKKLPIINENIKYSVFNKSDILYSDETKTIRRIQDKSNGLRFILLDSEMKNGYNLYIRMPVSVIDETVRISNSFIYIIAIITVILGGIAILIIAEKFTKPIKELNDITNRMTKLDFNKKIKVDNNDDEINELGKNINTLSDTLKSTIHQLKKNNSELEKNIEEKAKVDEMRKRFVSDVSHELKTPIALIQGYAEGLIENVNTDEKNRNFYANVILDESNKMDKLVKRLLELSRLENEDTKFNDTNFDIVDLIKGLITNYKVILKEENIEVEFDEKNPIYVCADDFYIEQVMSNYFTNAIKNVKEIDNQKKISISIRKAEEQGKVRISVFNTGKQIDEEDLVRIWNRFYKVDESRDRSKGGSGIGLSLVKAVMNKYNNKYGVENKENGVEFYFELGYSIISDQM